MYTLVYMTDKVISTRIPAELYSELAQASRNYLNEADFVRSAIRNEIMRSKILHIKMKKEENDENAELLYDELKEWVETQ